MDGIMMVSKIDLGENLIKGKSYLIEETPPIYEPVTLNLVKGYIVLGEKGWFKVDINNFVSLQDMREEKINSLLESSSI